MTARIEIHETISMEPNGDRDPNRHPCSAFKVIIINGDKKSVAFSNNQFDDFHTHISGTRGEYLSEAQKKAVDLSDTLGIPSELKPITTTARAQELRDIITQAEAELSELEKG